MEDKNQKGPNEKDSFISTFLRYAPRGMELIKNRIEWTPQKNQLGATLVELEAFDGIETTEQIFTIYVNDVPKIISRDSLKIAVGETLHYFIKAEDSNELTTLIYGIQSSLDGMVATPSTGEIVWTPTENDLGYNTIQASVSDQFKDLGKDMKPITIFVYKNPSFLDIILPEAYVGVEYKHIIKAENMNKQTLPEQDVFVNLIESNFKDIKFDKLTYELKIVPSFDEMGVQHVSMSLEDNFSNKVVENFPIKVLTSPCETSDTTYINSNQEGSVERSSSLVQKSYYKNNHEVVCRPS